MNRHLKIHTVKLVVYGYVLKDYTMFFLIFFVRDLILDPKMKKREMIT